jgi:DNA mismatch endonuclease, patch repair protein
MPFRRCSARPSASLWPKCFDVVKRWPGNTQQQATTFGGLSRSVLMSRIRSKRNVTTELKLVSLMCAAHLHGWRRNFPLLGNPDFVFLKSRLAVFVDGCFWHGHACGRNLSPKRNASLWQQKIDGNRRRDRRNAKSLRAAGWRVIRIWECTLKRRPEFCIRRIQRALT